MTRSVFTALAAAVTLLAGGEPAAAQGFFDVNAIRVQSAETSIQTYTIGVPLNLETAGFASSYPKLPIAAGGDVSGGFVSRMGLGIQGHVDFVEYKHTVGLGISIPSPYVFNNAATDGSLTNSSLKRQDIAIDLGAVYQLPLPSRLVSVKVFGGPTYFQVHNEMVSDISYGQVASPLFRINVVAIRGSESETVTGSTLGYHAGADIAAFFSRHVGVGGVIHFNQGTVSLRDPLSREDVDLKVGHTTVGAGIRFRF